jgi:hypothetical protein
MKFDPMKKAIEKTLWLENKKAMGPVRTPMAHLSRMGHAYGCPYLK